MIEEQQVRATTACMQPHDEPLKAELVKYTTQTRCEVSTPPGSIEEDRLDQILLWHREAISNQGR